jgi:hypothetical protein
MSNPLDNMLNTKRLDQMRGAADSLPLSPNDRHAVDAAIGRVESHWIQRKQEQYNNGLAQRDKAHGEVLEVVNATRAAAMEKLDEIKNGRVSAKEAGGWLRDVVGYHQQLTEQHNAVISMEPSLAEFEAQSVDDFQVQEFSRFPFLERDAPTLQKAVNEVGTDQRARATQRQARADQWAADHDGTERT